MLQEAESEDLGTKIKVGDTGVIVASAHSHTPVHVYCGNQR